MKRDRVLLVVLTAASIFAVTLGMRMAHSLFISAINTQTGLGLVAISFAFAVSQLMWGVSQPIAGAIADRYGAGRVIAGGILLVAVGNALIPFAGSTAALVFAVGILIACGAGASGPSQLLAAVARLIPPEKRAMASGIVNAGGSFGQFTLVPIALGVERPGGLDGHAMVAERAPRGDGAGCLGAAREGRRGARRVAR